MGMVDGDGSEAVGQVWRQGLDGFGVDVEDDSGVVGFVGEEHGAAAWGSSMGWRWLMNW